MVKNQLYGVIFVSRNKDNVNIDGFKERRMSFVTTRTTEELKIHFKDFVNKGKKGEFCRLYISINSRNEDKIQKALIHKLIDEKIKMQTIESVVASIAFKKEQAETKKWLFDYDGEEKELEVFIEDLKTAIANNPTKTTAEIESVNKTPNGFAIVVTNGFKTDNLLEKWGHIVELKRDSMLCVHWEKNT